MRVHLANERTMLAWQRTALAFTGLGSVVDRFAFEGRGDAPLGTVMGVLLSAGGAVTAVTGAWRYTQVEHQIDQGTCGSMVGAHVILAGAITVGAFVIGLYLLTSGLGEADGDPAHGRDAPGVARRLTYPGCPGSSGSTDRPAASRRCGISRTLASSVMNAATMPRPVTM